MAQYTIIEINNDHMQDCDPGELGMWIKRICHNPHAMHEVMQDHATPVCNRTIRYIGTTGEHFNPDDALDKTIWLNKGFKKE